MLRGELLRGAAETFPGGMNAVLGLDTRVVRRAAADGGGRVAIAAINAPRHLTITGVDADLDRLARTLARAGGALHPVDVAGPWHGPWLLSAADTLAARLATIPFHRPAVLVYSGVHGRIEDDPDRLRAVSPRNFTPRFAGKRSLTTSISAAAADFWRSARGACCATSCAAIRPTRPATGSRASKDTTAATVRCGV